MTTTPKTTLPGGRELRGLHAWIEAKTPLLYGTYLATCPQKAPVVLLGGRLTAGPLFTGSGDKNVTIGVSVTVGARGFYAGALTRRVYRRIAA